jgi:hypothetical protein
MVGSYGGWWSTTEYDSSDVWYRYMGYNNAYVARYDINQSYSFSLRCARD